MQKKNPNKKTGRKLAPDQRIYNDMMIGVIDSGIGGLTVLAPLLKRKCADRYLYLADGANMPYGNKSKDELCDIALANVKTLAERGANAIVFACNTLSVCTLETVRKETALPLFGLIPRPELTFGNALMVTTPATGSYLPPLPKKTALLTPARLAALIDGNYPDLKGVQSYLRPLLVPYEDVDCVYLGCSHYLLAKEVFGRLLPHAKLLDGATPLASLVQAVLPPVLVKKESVDFLFTGKDETARYCSILSSLLA